NILGYSTDRAAEHPAIVRRAFGRRSATILAKPYSFLEVDHRKITPNEFRHLILRNGAVLDPAIEEQGTRGNHQGGGLLLATAARSDTSRQHRRYLSLPSPRGRLRYADWRAA